MTTALAPLTVPIGADDRIARSVFARMRTEVATFARGLSVETAKVQASMGRIEAAMAGAQARALAFRSTMAGLMSPTGLAASLATALGIREFITNTIEAEASLAQLEAAIASTGGAAGMTSGELTALAGEMQRVTTFGDDAVVGAEALLLTFTRIGREVFPDALRSILDVSTAMKQDLQASTVQVGKALNDPIRGLTALSKAGIQFTEAQKVMIKALVEAGDLVGAQRIMLKELETQFGGSARAARETLGGALAALKNSFGDMFEVGSEGSDDLRLSIERVIAVISDPATMAAVQNFGAGLFSGFAQAIEGAREFVVAMQALQKGDFATFMALEFFPTSAEGNAWNFAAKLRTGLVDMQADIAETAEFYDAFGDTFAGATETATAAVADLTAETALATDALRQGLAGEAIATSDALKGRFADAFGDATKAVGDLRKEVDIPLPRMRPEVIELKGVLKDATDAAADFGVTLIDGLAGGEELASTLADALGGLAGSLGSDLLGDLGTNIGSSIGGTAGSIFGAILGPIGSALGNAAGSLLGDLFGDLFGDDDEEERLRRKEARQRRREQRERREDKIEQQEERQLARRESRARQSEGFIDRAFTAGLDTSTLGGAVAELEREQLREREELIREGGNKLNQRLRQLAEAHNAEMLALQRNFADASIAEAERMLEEFNQAGRGIVDYINDLNTGPDTTLAPADRLAASESTFWSQYALAQGGNVDAMASITKYADAFLNASRDFNASSTAFQEDRQAVIDALLSLPAVQQSTDPVVQALAVLQGAVLDALDPLARDTSLSPLPGLLTEQQLIALGLATNSGLSPLTAINTNTSNTATRVDGVAKDTTLTGDADNGLTGVKNKVKDVRDAIDIVKGDTKWLPVMAQRLYEVALFTGQAKGVNEKPLAGDDRTAYSAKPKFVGFAQGGMIPGLAAGGMVGNGIWNVDSVRARYAGGGNIDLAGGEFVTRAPSVNAMTMPILDAINRTGRMPAVNDNGRYFADQNRVLLAGFRATIETLQSEIAGLRAEVRGSGNRVAQSIDRKPVAKPATKMA